MKIHYEVVEHDGGWAYKFDNVFSEPFATKAAALEAAERVAAEQRVPVEPADIEYQGPDGKWRSEHTDGRDRPETDAG